MSEPSEPKMMAPADFRREGFLLEVNRTFLHPLGLALDCDDERGTMRVWDCRDDPEGIRYELDADTVAEATAKAAQVEAEREKRHAARQAALGYVVQPLDRLAASPA